MSGAVDTLATAVDSLSIADSSATKKPKPKKNLLTTDVKTSAKDSTIFSLDGKKVFLFGDAKIEYEDIVLTAAYIEADMDQGIIYAEGVADSTGTIQGKPLFTQGDEEMKAINITYNVNTKRGYIEKLYTEQEDGYLHSELTKKEVDNSINMPEEKNISQQTEFLDEKTLEFEFFMMGLRTRRGISSEKYMSFFKRPLPSRFLEVFEQWKKKKLAQEKNGYFSLNSDGMLFLNRFLEEIY